jgi:hypothetical protein
MVQAKLSRAVSIINIFVLVYSGSEPDPCSAYYRPKTGIFLACSDVNQFQISLLIVSFS